MQHQTDTRFPDAAAADYDRRILTLVPGYQFAQALLTATLAQTLPNDATLLLAGCGTGSELEALAAANASWRFSAVEPSAGMLAAARAKAEAADYAQRVSFQPTLLQQAPQTRHDAAVCSLVLHFIADDGAKLEFLQQLAQRLSPVAPLLLFDYQPDGLPASHYQHWLQSAGHSAAQAQEVIERTRRNWHPMAAARSRLLLAESGFTAPQHLCGALGFQLSLLHRRR
ncbi:class I SAM-dependent methyltransferase [Serratia marcescens]|uniref:methyltransferase n=1 Tax=Serratia marcescens TaxID=615 RepID=UPI0011F1F4C6|nr:class I SAM-dependent methyltransferase [Serratia marcescens]QKO40296.1 class I SAM-dependent methyltransferase [Serratia marcescens]